MATLREQIAADMAAAIECYEQTFEWFGDSYSCVRRDEPTMAELQDAGGFVEQAKYFLVVAKGAFTGDLPADGDLINSGTHQIKSVRGHKDPASAQLVLAIGTADT